MKFWQYKRALDFPDRRGPIKYEWIINTWYDIVVSDDVIRYFNQLECSEKERK